MSPASANTTSAKEAIRALALKIRPRLARVIIFLNGKGGAGKTTLTSNSAVNIARALAESGSTKRVLTVDLDLQGNLGLDLGYKGHDEDDAGQSIVNIVMGAGKLRIIRDVRPQMDCVPGGRMLRYVSPIMATSRQTDFGREPRLALAEAIAEIAEQYEWIVVDCPPGQPELQDIAAVLARYLVIPVSFDEGSLEGMTDVADILTQARELNPDITPLGVVLFRFDRNNLRNIKQDGEVIGSKEVGLLARTRTEVAEKLAEAGISLPIFNSVVTEAKTVATLCRKWGRAMAELADAAAQDDWRAAARQHGVAVTAESAETSAAEQEAITREILTRALELEHAA
ncbi:ParA family protein [Sphaerisporangium sp. NPDC049002]|uniref:ParA family protein n=1 Tax=Sphaerisporangium sp. NPDC049002 TaxID=3155392 RepID=UPI0033F9599E